MVPETLSSSIMAGLYNTSTTSQFACGSGNYTWPTFYSLGVCNSCQDVTNATTVGCQNQTYARKCSYTTPGGFNLWFTDQNEPTILNATAKGSNYGSSLSSSRISRDGEIIARLAISKFRVVGESEIFSSTNSLDFRLISTEFTECRFSWCVKGYHNVSVAAGQISTPNVTEHKLYVPNGTTLTGDDWLIGQFSILDPSPSWNQSLVWSLNEADRRGVSSYFRKLFDTSHREATGMLLSQTSDVKQRMDNIADSMSNFIRSSDNATEVFGREEKIEVYVLVSWLWLILPVLIVLLSSLLLLVSVLSTRLNDQELWKSSTLALLFAGLDAWEGREEHWDSPMKLEKEASMMTALLEKDPIDGRLRFVAE